jgi:rSAM/selenodomain-associated transferase 1
VAAKLIILFAKSPVPGRVKTRLFPVLPPDLAAELHSAFVLDTIDRLRQVDGANLELHTDTCSDAWGSLGVTRKVQISGDLGLKMVHALDEGLRAGADRVLILGSDAPTLPLTHIRGLLDASADIALGPATDGGFYAISARATHPAMFDNVPWSHRDTLARAVTAIRTCGLSVEFTDSWFDIDEPADLKRLIASNDLPPHTAACLAKIKALPGIALSVRSAD